MGPTFGSTSETFDTDGVPDGVPSPSSNVAKLDSAMHTIATPAIWLTFVVVVVVALIIDFAVLRHKGAQRVSVRAALHWSIAWIVLALVFNAGLWAWTDMHLGRDMANTVALEFLAGYLIEKTLAVDNMFVFLMLFNYFAVPAEQQRRVLMIGVLGAIILRTLMILAGAALIAKAHWILYLFGIFLLLTGINMLRAAGEEPDIINNPILRWIQRHLPVAPDYHGDALHVRLKGRWYVTPLFVVVMFVAVADVIFAVDSIPAVFAITMDPFLVITSNVLAVLGLRALYFLLAGMADRFHLLAYGLAVVLIFIGIKMLISGFYAIPVAVALVVVAVLVGASMVASVMIKPRQD